MRLATSGGRRLPRERMHCRDYRAGRSSYLVASIVGLSVVGAPPQAVLAADFELPLERAVNQQLASPVLDATLAPFSNPVAVGLTPLVLAAPLGLEAVGKVGVAELASLGAFEGIKLLVHRPRPYTVDPSLRIPFGPESEWSFPSGHVTIAFASATMLAHDYPGWAPLFYSLSSLVALSRIYGGVHYPTDTIGGALIGYGVAQGVLAADQWLESTYHLRPAGSLLSEGWRAGIGAAF